MPVIRRSVEKDFSAPPPDILFGRNLTVPTKEASFVVQQEGDRPESVADQLRRQADYVETLLDEIAKRRTEAESAGLSFTALTGDQILEKLQRAHSPFIWGLGLSSAPPGGTVGHTVWFSNPDADPWFYLYITVLVGPGNISSSLDTALLAVNDSFPQLTLPGSPGASLAPGESQSLTFDIRVPATAEPTNYFLTDFFFQGVNLPTTLLDRVPVCFQVT